MTKYLLDTGILLGYVRAAHYAKYIEQTFELMTPTNISYISIVTVGEIYSLAAQLHWGDKKKKVVESLLDDVYAIDINDRDILERYAEIDAFSQGRHVERKLPDGMSSRNMGKNDLWIAASVSVSNAKLLTTDRDFDHLHKEFLEVIYIDPSADYKIFVRRTPPHHSIIPLFHQSRCERSEPKFISIQIEQPIGTFRK